MEEASTQQQIYCISQATVEEVDGDTVVRLVLEQDHTLVLVEENLVIAYSPDAAAETTRASEKAEDDDDDDDPLRHDASQPPSPAPVLPCSAATAHSSSTEWIHAWKVVTYFKKCFWKEGCIINCIDNEVGQGIELYFELRQCVFCCILFPHDKDKAVTFTPIMPLKFPWVMTFLEDLQTKCLSEELYDLTFDCRITVEEVLFLFFRRLSFYTRVCAMT